MKHDPHNSPAPRGKGGRHRARRAFDNGTLRQLILQMIGEQPRHGYEIMAELETRSAGAYRPSPGVLYPNLSALESEGLILCEPVDGRRKLCRITDLGRRHLALAETVPAPGADRRGGHRWKGRVPAEIAEAMDALKAALRRGFLDTGAGPSQIGTAAAAIRAAAATIEGLEISPAPATDPAAAKETGMTQIITRHRHELRRRELSVRSAENLTPNMRRIVLEGPELEGFCSLGFDDHIKLFFETGGAKPEMRDYTPRAFGDGTLVLDFAMHEAGPATDWARAAAPGSRLRIGGPKGSSVIAPVFDWHLLVGDETALPAIGRRVEELPGDTEVLTLAAVSGAAEEQQWQGAAAHVAHWIHRADPADPALVLEALRALQLPAGRGFVWIAAEAGVARALKRHMLEERGHPGEWLKASGYWTAGQSDAAEKSLD
ncbi:SIP domain-containing protein [Mangrovicoccus algicola]|uniref:SIP domain-containing protein n=1 Tax=Mangrovicoccus algicola TaxID=2771008 RepID=A0A8J6ZDB6_9RHOB|nr:SIP domain-containing protein [Mangrovicoccus algicola]MBE3639980.1 SIP domain-containing protein [Mangrovicoccus algicola]